MDRELISTSCTLSVFPILHRVDSFNIPPSCRAGFSSLLLFKRSSDHTNQCQSFYLSSASAKHRRQARLRRVERGLPPIRWRPPPLVQTIVPPRGTWIETCFSRKCFTRRTKELEISVKMNGQASPKTLVAACETKHWKKKLLETSFSAECRQVSIIRQHRKKFLSIHTRKHTRSETQSRRNRTSPT